MMCQEASGVEVPLSYSQHLLEKVICLLKLLNPNEPKETCLPYQSINELPD